MVADPLSRKHTLLSSMKVKVIGFETFKEPYENDVDFGRIYESCKQGSFNLLSSFDGFLFKNNALCIGVFIRSVRLKLNRITQNRINRIIILRYR